MTPGIDQVEKVRESTDKLSGLIQWLVTDVLRGTAIKRLSFALVLLVLVFNPLSASYFGGVFNVRPPHWYVATFWTVTLALAAATILIAVLTTPRKQILPPVSTRAIRGLIPFTGQKEDVELFAKLQRQREISEIITAICDPGFQIGYVSGDSGSGKTSLVHAGVAPRVEVCYPVVVELSDLDPIESIREGLGALVAPDAHSASIADLLASAARVQGKPILLILDQFEQFFVHRARPLDRRPFIESLRQWFDARPRIPAKILISIRGDFADRLVELQKALGYTLVANHVFRLEQFQPEQAVAIFRVLAESEQIPFDESFVHQMVREELANREDGMVSAVDIQVLSWVIAGLPDSKQRAFSRESVKLSGGVEGLLERYLQKSLAAVPHLQEPATKVLLTLIDLDQNARAGALAIKEISTRLEGKIAQKTLTEALGWLTDPRVRLVISFQRKDQTLYQLVHERLIPALRKIAFGILGESERANEILNRRVREWLDNGRSRRYLLTWGEWRLVSQQRSFLVWGEKRQQKEEFLRLTFGKWRRRVVFAACLALVAAGVVGFSYSSRGQIALVEWELRTYLNSDISDDDRAPISYRLSESRSHLNEALRVADGITESVARARPLAVVASALARAGACSKDTARFEQAKKVAENITDFPFKEMALYEVASAPAVCKDTALLEQAKKVAESIAEPHVKTRALGAVASAYAQAGDSEQAAALFKQAEKLTEGMTDLEDRAWALENVASAHAQAGDTQQAVTLFEQARKVAERIPDSVSKAQVLQSVTSELVQAGTSSRDISLFERAGNVADSIAYPPSKRMAFAGIASALAQAVRVSKDTGTAERVRQVCDGIMDPVFKAVALSAVASPLAQAGDTKQAEATLEQARNVAGNIKDPDGKTHGLLSVASALAQAGDTTQAEATFEQARNAARSITDPILKDSAISDVASALARASAGRENSRLVKESRNVAGSIQDPVTKEYALEYVASALAQAGSATMDISVFDQAQDVAESINDPSSKSRALSDLALALAQAGAASNQPSLLERAQKVAESITDRSIKADALQAVAGELAAAGQIRTARQLAQKQVDDGEKALTLATILQRASSDSLPEPHVEAPVAGR